MNRSLVRSLAKVLAGAVAVLSISMAPAGCAGKKCGCGEAKAGAPCDKPCPHKDGAAAPAAKPAEKKAEEKKP